MKPSFDNTYYKNTVDNNDAVAFQVETDPAIMKRLSDDIYQYPIEAIIRELGTNAFDAHIDAGNMHKQFDVHLPVEGDQSFIQRDYGTGLNKEDLLNMYTRYAKSTRRDSNNHIGSIGIGSKSPFAYTSQFSVISYFNGTKITGLCYKDEYHVPYMKIVDECETDEPNGLQIEFPVDIKDCDEFLKTAKKVYQWFELRPNTNIKLNYSDTPSEDYFLRGDNWILFDHRKHDLAGSVLMGGVLYRSPYYMSQNGLILTANIGDVGINISRESIQSNDNNKKWVEKAYEEAKADMLEKLQKKADGISEVYKIMGFCADAERIINCQKVRIRRNGALVEKSMRTKNYEIDRMHRSDSQSGYSNQIYAHFFRESYDHFLHNDLKTGFIKAGRKYMKDNDLNYCNMIRGDIDAFCQQTDYPKSKIKLASDYYVRETGTSNGTFAKNKVLLFSPSKNGIPTNRHSVWWSAQTAQINNSNKKLLYCEIKNYKNNTHSNDVIAQLVDFKNYDLLGVKPSKISWVKQQNIISLDTYIDNLQPTQDQIDKWRSYCLAGIIRKRHCYNEAVHLYKELLATPKLKKYLEIFLSPGDQAYINKYIENSYKYNTGGYRMKQPQEITIIESIISKKIQKTFKTNASLIIDSIEKTYNNSKEMQAFYRLNRNLQNDVGHLLLDDLLKNSKLARTQANQK